MRVRSLSLLQLVSVRCSLGYLFGREIGAQGWPARVRAVARFASDVLPHPYTDFEMAQTRTRTLGPAARPVAVPADLDNPSLPKASGRIELPPHIRWSGPPLTYDLNDRSDRARVYEQVLREGTADDVRFYVDAERLLELWDELVLPPAVREAWTSWIERRRHAA